MAKIAKMRGVRLSYSIGIARMGMELVFSRNRGMYHAAYYLTVFFFFSFPI